jgi:hypothetical protein
MGSLSRAGSFVCPSVDGRRDWLVLCLEPLAWEAQIGDVGHAHVPELRLGTSLARGQRV